MQNIPHHPLGQAFQPVLNPEKGAPAQAMGSWLFQDNTVGDSLKGFAEAQLDNIHSLSLIP